MSNKIEAKERLAMTIVEILVALAIMGLLGIIVAQCVFWSLSERTRLAANQASLEIAANVLEAARAQPWQDLNQSWAGAQTIPSEMQALVPDGKVIVTVDFEQPEPGIKQVTVEVRWQIEEHLPPHSVHLTGLFSRRMAQKTGDKP
jgi:type II secretory pathway pseudopilin PulG